MGWMPRAPYPAHRRHPRFPRSGLRLATSPRGDTVTGCLPPCQGRRCRRRFRTATTGRTRTPSIGSTRTLRPEQAWPRALFTCVASPRTLSPAASPICPVKGRQVASSYPELARTAVPLPAQGPRSLRERCVSPTSATDSRHEHPADRSIPGCTLVAPRLATIHDQRPTHPGPKPHGGEAGSLPAAFRMSQPGGASLDGEPPASACAATSTWYPRAARRRAGAWAPDVHVCGEAWSWRSPDRRLLRASPPGGGVFDRSPGLRPDL
jgi:hypothetical protein